MAKNMPVPNTSTLNATKTVGIQSMILNISRLAFGGNCRVQMREEKKVSDGHAGWLLQDLRAFYLKAIPNHPDKMSQLKTTQDDSCQSTAAIDRDVDNMV